MFKKFVAFYSFALVSLIGVLLAFVLHISEADRIRFKKIQARGIAKAQASASTEQNRSGVSKDLWITQADGKRLHDHIESASSILVLTPINDHLDIVEHLNQIRCSMQDRIEEQGEKVSQQIRCFDALSGIYQYSENRLSAKNVSLALFRLPGADLPSSFSNSKPYLQGVAQDVSFAVAGKESQFQAKSFKATFVGKPEATQ